MTSLLPLWAAAALANNPAMVELDPTAHPDWEPGFELLEDGWVGPAETLDVDVSEVVGGKQVQDDKWPDTVGIVFSSQYVGCTGTLVGPKVVLTAGHCVDGGFISHVMVGGNDWLTNPGEMIAVDEVFEYPDSQWTYDIAVLTLQKKAPVEPRAIGLECVLDEHLEDGAPVQIVGYGLTTESGTGFNSMLNEARSTVLDADCSEEYINDVYSGCNGSIDVGGEIAAGGQGTDACFGDSGGPLYLKTGDGAEGAYLVGVTSRAFLGVDPRYPCRDGGIWVRPDAVIRWIENQVGNKKLTYPSCNEAPAVNVDDILTYESVPGTTLVSVDDPDGSPEDATVEVVQEPENGTVEIQEDGTAVYTPNAGFIGEDSFTVAVSDAGNDDYKRTGEPVTVELDVPVQVQEGRPPGEGVMAGCTCNSGAGVPSAAGLLGLLGLVGLRRRS